MLCNDIITKIVIQKCILYHTYKLTYCIYNYRFLLIILVAAVWKSDTTDVDRLVFKATLWGRKTIYSDEDDNINGNNMVAED